MEHWKQYTDGLYYSAKARLMIDWGGMDLSDDFFALMGKKLANSFDFMTELEAGAIANPSEERMVGHYWLRNTALAPTDEIRNEITRCLEDINSFVSLVHGGELRNSSGEVFRNVIVAGVGGSILGSEFVYKTLPHKERKMNLYFMDNTDPAGIDDVFDAVNDELDATIVIIISKSGKTVETRNCMEEARVFYESRGLSFPRHAVSISERGSMLDRLSVDEGWLSRFHIWNWVGGRTSVMSAVGLLPMALAGVDIMAMLRGAAECDELTRIRDAKKNPAALMALSWYRCSGGKGGETMVILPYKDSLSLLAKYLQQLVMESLGKEFDTYGNVVNQGLTVMGNKGSSDQHSYAQQLIAGSENTFVTFLQVLRDRDSGSPIVGDNSTSGDFLQAFMLGMKKALESHGRRTMTITIPTVTAYHVGKLVALFERTVGLYACLINVNAYDQPAVEQGKKAGGGLITLKNAARNLLEKSAGRYMTAVEIADSLGARPDDVFRLMLHLAANDPRVMMREEEPVWESTFAVK